MVLIAMEIVIKFSESEHILNFLILENDKKNNLLFVNLIYSGFQ